MVHPHHSRRRLREYTVDGQKLWLTDRRGPVMDISPRLGLEPRSHLYFNRQSPRY